MVVRTTHDAFGDFGLQCGQRIPLLGHDADVHVFGGAIDVIDEEHAARMRQALVNENADLVGENHIRARFKSGDGKMVNAIAFRVAGQPLGQTLLDNRGRPMHAAGHLAVDRWQGEERVQMRLTDVALS